MQNSITRLTLDDEFLAPLAKVFGEFKLKEAWLDDLLPKCQHLSLEQLVECAEWVKVNHGGKTVPSLKILRDAVQNWSDEKTVKKVQIQSGKRITRENYFEQIKAFRSPNPDGTVYVVITGDQDEFIAWMEYFESLNMSAAKTMRERLFSPAESWTAPTQWPWQFDRYYSKKRIDASKYRPKKFEGNVNDVLQRINERQAS